MAAAAEATKPQTPKAHKKMVGPLLLRDTQQAAHENLLLAGDAVSGWLHLGHVCTGGNLMDAA
jgi:hypothetical protein